MNLLSKAIRIATVNHDGQVDKAGEPYVFHPLRVMLNMTTETERVVAVLHDVLEDTEVTADELKVAGFSDEIIKAVECLTRGKDEDYFDFIKRCKENSIAKIVKLADIDDNMDVRRIKNPTERDIKRNLKYSKAQNILLGFE